MKIIKDNLMESYPLRIKKILLAVVLLAVLGAYMYPRFMNEGLRTRHSFTEVVESFDIPATEQFIAPPPPSRPLIPVISDDLDYAEDVTIEETDLDNFAGWGAPPPILDKQSHVRFILYEEPPEPIGGYDALLKNLIYPDMAREAGVEGTIIVQAFIDITGRVTQTEILKGIPQTGMNEAAVDAVRKTRFRPAKQRDVEVAVWVAIPITFQLQSRGE